MVDVFVTGGFAVTSGIIAAKWSMDLGFTQLQQLLIGICGVIAGPFVLLILYLRLLRKAPESARRFA